MENTNPIQWEEEIFVPREDSIIIFPSRLRHYVSAHECSETRVSVAGNIVFLD